jgi:hypothetical protein
MATFDQRTKNQPTVHWKDGQAVTLYSLVTLDAAADADIDQIFDLPPGTTILSLTARTIVVSVGFTTHVLQVRMEDATSHALLVASPVDVMAANDFQEWDGVEGFTTGLENKSDGDAVIEAQSQTTGAGPFTTAGQVEFIMQVVRTDYLQAIGP